MAVQRKIAVSLFCLFLFIASAWAEKPLQEALPAPYPAPEIAGIEDWMNSPPLTIASLKGKVVLVDFWAYSCINCIRTLPYLTQWDAQYRDKGLVILGVHAPEFEFEKDAKNVRKAIARYAITYPVALDNHLSTWSNFNNQYWPAHYLINKEGQVVYTHFGEGKYAITEHNIRNLLGLEEGAEKNAEQKNTSGNQTPETYLGYARAQHFSGVPALVHESPALYDFTSELPLHHWDLKGKWRVEAEKIVSLEANATLRLHFNAKKIFLVLGTQSTPPAEVRVVVNGKEEKILTVKDHKLYTLIEQNQLSEGMIEINSPAAGVEIYAFTFEG